MWQRYVRSLGASSGKVQCRTVVWPRSRSVVEPAVAATFEVPIGKFSGDDRERGGEEWKADIILGPPLDFGANNCNGPQTRKSSPSSESFWVHKKFRGGI